MIVVTATDLTSWANLREAQSSFPQLIRRLILATASGLESVSIRSGEGVGLPGWDGVVEARNVDAHVPKGLSVWEMGVSQDAAAKAESDYQKRKHNPSGISPASTTFVFVTPRRWPGKGQWVEKKRQDDFWRKVIVYDGDDLEAWLERVPAVQAWACELLGKHPHGAKTLERWWNFWSNSTRPALPAPLLLSGRDSDVEQVISAISKESDPLALSSDSQEETIAFIAAAFISSTSPNNASLLEHALIVSTPDAWHYLVHSPQPLILLPVFERPDTVIAVDNGHRVIIPLGRENEARNGIRVARLRRDGIESALIRAGLPRNRASSLATIGRRSLLSLRRELAITPELQTPTWASPDNARSVLPAVLGGRWQDNLEGDREIIAELAGQPYEEYAGSLNRWANSSDPPVRLVGNVWILSSKQDAWALTARYLMPIDFERLRQSVQRVLGGDDQFLSLPPEEQMVAVIRGKHRAYSQQLLEGLADTLALMAASAESVVFADGRRGQDEANPIVERLLFGTDNRVVSHSWKQLSPVLPLLAEAAPDVFLRAVESGLKGSEPIIIQLFEDGRKGSSSFGTSSAHTGLLWALECLAWSSDYLLRVVLLLAKLTRVDPGGGLGNRPGSSLREVLRIWYPSTTATLEQRLAAIDIVRKREPSVAWSLMLDLIPQGPVIATPTHAPAWRTWKPEQEKGSTYVEIHEVITALTMRLLEDVSANAARWAEFLKRLADLPPQAQSTIVERLTQLEPENLSDVDRSEIVDSLRSIVGRHHHFPDSKWVLPNVDIDHLMVLIERFEAREPCERNAWLFDRRVFDWLGYIGTEEQQIELAHLQANAVQEILGAYGLVGLLSWSERLQDANGSYRVGLGLGRIGLDEGEGEELLEYLISNVEAHRQIALGYIFQSANREDGGMTAWAEALISKEVGLWPSPKQAAFLVALAPSGRVWDLAERYGEETDRRYWQLINWYRVPVDSEARVRAARKLIEHGLPYATIELLGFHADGVPQPRLTELIENALVQAEKTTIPDYIDTNMLAVHVRRHLDYLSTSGLSEEKLASLEWTYLPLFRFDDKPHSLTLQRRLAADPAFFVELLSLAYRSEDEEPRELSEQDSYRARIAHALLHSWHIVPGINNDNSIDEQKLRDWVIQARELLNGVGLGALGDEQIGRILYYGPQENDTEWPTKAIRDLIEELESEHIERGLHVEVINRRGWTSRGLIEGGTQERDLAAKYRRFSRSAFSSWPRTATLLTRIAEDYEGEARYHDNDAEITEDLWR